MSQRIADASFVDEPITDREQLIEFFREGCKGENDQRVGVEFEKIGVHAQSGHAIPYHGEYGVEGVFSRLCERFGWEPIIEQGATVALRRGRELITLEPGGQVEYTMPPERYLSTIGRMIEQHLAELNAVGEGEVRWLGLGMQPLSRATEIERVPKQRYDVMAAYLPTRGARALQMMMQTASVQVSLDFHSEEDAIFKLRLAQALSPILIGIFANSSISEGAPNGYRSLRGAIWRETDPDRCGLIPQIFAEGADFQSYTAYALDVPMFFVFRNETYIPTGGMTFRQFLEGGGFEGFTPHISDWELHLTTIFTEARLKRFVEFRCADTLPMPYLLSIPALYKGICYTQRALEAAWDLVAHIPVARLDRLLDLVPRMGLETPVAPGSTLRELAQELVRIARGGLEAQIERDPGNAADLEYLEPIESLVCETCRSHADRILEEWNGPWQGDLGRLLEACSY
ncbi:MAG: glutamate--cysteine ligase [Deltaproteobacteria bacterium]|nr:MAG: glutamate--cysteine ligase [Deltaproteobacteria bacterium]